MGRADNVDTAAIGRFDTSFTVHMIKDFFVILIAVMILEFAIKAGLVYWEFRSSGEEKAMEVAGDIAANVRSIMRNEGGPVAASTVYPILEKNWGDIGYSIAVEPSEITISAIEDGFGFTPQGILADDWPDGVFRGASVDVVAEPGCLACHATAEIGDVLGTVTVRSYLATDLGKWWQDVKLSGGLAIGKILLHSVLLFLLLRARLEPLMGLRAVVSTLARAYGGLNHRARIRSTDEFGALSRDLNLFLDRISQLVREIDHVLKQVVDVNDDILSIGRSLRDQLRTVTDRTRTLERQALLSAKREPLLSNEWFDAIKGSIQDLDAALAAASDAPQAEPLLDHLRAVVSNAEGQIKSNEALFADLAELGTETERLQIAIAEMNRLEERMKIIVEAGSALVQRLNPDADENPTPAK